MRTKMLFNALIAAIGYQLVNWFETQMQWSSEVSLGVSAALLMLPRIPRIGRWLGVGMLLANNMIQGYASNVTGMFYQVQGGK